jgi:hypothetical protein
MTQEALRELNLELHPSKHKHITLGASDWEVLHGIELVSKGWHEGNLGCFQCTPFA